MISSQFMYQRTIVKNNDFKERTKRCSTPVSCAFLTYIVQILTSSGPHPPESPLSANSGTEIDCATLSLSIRSEPIHFGSGNRAGRCHGAKSGQPLDVRSKAPNKNSP